MQPSRNQDRAMTRERLLFRAHEGEPVSRRVFENPLYATLEFLSIRQQIVANLSASVARRIFRARAQLIAEKDILNSSRGQRRFQNFPIELWMQPAIRARPDVRNAHNSVRAQQFDEPFQFVRGMADRE